MVNERSQREAGQDKASEFEALGRKIQDLDVLERCKELNRYLETGDWRLPLHQRGTAQQGARIHPTAKHKAPSGTRAPRPKTTSQPPAAPKPSPPQRGRPRTSRSTTSTLQRGPGRIPTPHVPTKSSKGAATDLVSALGALNQAAGKAGKSLGAQHYQYTVQSQQNATQSLQRSLEKRERAAGAGYLARCTFGGIGGGTQWVAEQTHHVANDATVEPVAAIVQQGPHVSADVQHGPDVSRGVQHGPSVDARTFAADKMQERYLAWRQSLENDARQHDVTRPAFAEEPYIVADEWHATTDQQNPTQNVQHAVTDGQYGSSTLVHARKSVAQPFLVPIQTITEEQRFITINQHDIADEQDATTDEQHATNNVQHTTSHGQNGATEQGHQRTEVTSTNGDCPTVGHHRGEGRSGSVSGVEQLDSEQFEDADKYRRDMDGGRQHDRLVTQSESPGDTYWVGSTQASSPPASEAVGGASGEQQEVHPALSLSPPSDVVDTTSALRQLDLDASLPTLSPDHSAPLASPGAALQPASSHSPRQMAAADAAIQSSPNVASTPPGGAAEARPTDASDARESSTIERTPHTEGSCGDRGQNAVERSGQHTEGCMERVHAESGVEGTLDQMGESSERVRRVVTSDGWPPLERPLVDGGSVLHSWHLDTVGSTRAPGVSVQTRAGALPDVKVTGSYDLRLANTRDAEASRREQHKLAIEHHVHSHVVGRSMQAAESAASAADSRSRRATTTIQNYFMGDLSPLSWRQGPQEQTPN